MYHCDICAPCDILHDTPPCQCAQIALRFLRNTADMDHRAHSGLCYGAIRARRWSAIPPLTHILPSGNQTLDNIGNGESPINGQLQWQNHVNIYVTYVTCKSCWPHARRTATTSASTDQLQLPLAMASEGSKDQAMCRAKCDLRSAGFIWAHHLGQSLESNFFPKHSWFMLVWHVWNILELHSFDSLD